VLPFNLVTVATLAVVGRVPALRRLARLPRPLRLAWLAGPEQARATERARRGLARLVQGADRICVLTGAGVSTAAGLPDVRGPGGLWLRTRLITLDEFVASAETREVYWREEEAFFDLVRRASPAPVHHALAVLGRRGRLTAVITQNVDGLHQASGLPRELVVELHGSVHAAVCLDCGEPVPRAALSPAIARGQSPYCTSCRGHLKGGGTMFGEPVGAGRLDAALRALLDADLLLVLGSSLLVSPAADIVRWAREAGVPTAIVNATPTGRDAAAEIVLRDNVNDVLADIVADESRQAVAARFTPFPAG
jgi:NAD-dependent deacetylase